MKGVQKEKLLNYILESAVICYVHHKELTFLMVSP